MSGLRTASPYLMCFLAAVFYCYEYLLRVAPSVMAPELMQHFQLNFAGFGNLVACYYLIYVPLQLPVGFLIDRWGPRKILSIACLLCASGTYLFVATTHLSIAKIGRALVGCGSAFAYVGFLKVVAIWLPRNRFAMMAGLCSALGMLGAVMGEWLMAYWVDLLDWQPALLTCVGLGGILALVLGMILNDGNKSLASPPTLQQSLLAFRPIIMNKQLWINGIIGGLLFMPLTAFAEIWAVPFLQAVGLSKPMAAVGSSMIFVGYAIGAPIWGMISQSMASRRYPLMLGAMISTLLALFVVQSPPSNVMLLLGLMFVFGVLASVQILVFAVGNDEACPEKTGMTAAMINFLVMLVGLIMQPLIGYLLDCSQATSAVKLQTPLQAYQHVLIVLPLGLFIASILSYCLQETFQD